MTAEIQSFRERYEKHRSYYIRANNGMPCPDDCQICRKVTADARGKTAGIKPVSFDTYGAKTQ